TRWPGAFIAAWLAIQLALPLHYYLLRRDDHDERFAWRMFSPMRMMKCSVEMTVGGRPVALEREFHDAWLRIAERGRRSVVAAMGARLCRKYPAQPVVARLTCRPLKGEPYQVGGFDLCEVPEL
ncbi:MAG TPA: hypothetical protein VM734_36310, partial [Kofleriaceae bacterium]|nr:hypothetical protein [Kofleriaceae bacterium]